MKNYIITVNGRSYEVSVEEAGVASASVAAAPVVAPVAAPVAAAAPVAQAATPKQTPPAAPAANVDGTKVSSPMPGTILDIKVSVGQQVKKGDTVVILEAMKMENEIPAPCDGTVAAISASKGSTVNAGDALVVIG